MIKRNITQENQNITIKTKKGKELSKKEKTLINKSRVKEYGDGIIDFKNKSNSIVFFVKDKNKIVSFGMLNPIKITYLKKTYNILGIGQILSLKKGKGYGKILIQSIIKYLKKKGKTGIGFCGGDHMPFYEKGGLKTKMDLINKFRYKNPKTGKIIKDDEGGGGSMYYNGKDNFVNKIISKKALAYSNIDFW